MSSGPVVPRCFGPRGPVVFCLTCLLSTPLETGFARTHTQRHTHTHAHTHTHNTHARTHALTHSLTLPHAHSQRLSCAILPLAWSCLLYPTCRGIDLEPHRRLKRNSSECGHQLWTTPSRCATAGTFTPLPGGVFIGRSFPVLPLPANEACETKPLVTGFPPHTHLAQRSAR